MVMIKKYIKSGIEYVVIIVKHSRWFEFSICTLSSIKNFSDDDITMHHISDEIINGGEKS
jgi:hypothetical protein